MFKKPTAKKSALQRMKEAFTYLHQALPVAFTKKEKARRLKEQYEKNSTPPTDFLPFVRNQTRQVLWFRATMKFVLRRSGRSKLEKKLIKQRLFQGHWDLIRPRYFVPSGAAAKKRAKRIQRTEEYRQATGYYNCRSLSDLIAA